MTREELLAGAELARWCYDHPNLAARTIEGLRAPAQAAPEPYVTDLEFANKANIAAARKYKARLEYMEAKYGQIDWDAALSSPPPAPPISFNCNLSPEGCDCTDYCRKGKP